MPPAFSYKLQDILTMYRGFRSAISGMYITAEEVLEAFCDMAEESKLLQDAEAAGCKTVGGLGMLIYQGAAAAKLYTGLDMPVEEVKEKFFKK